MSHFKGGERLGKITCGRWDAGEKFKGGERGAGLFETTVREAGGKEARGRKQANDINPKQAGLFADWYGRV